MQKEDYSARNVKRRWWWPRDQTNSTPRGKSRRQKNCCEAKENQLSLWGEEKIKIPMRCKLPCSWNEINYCCEAKRKLITTVRRELPCRRKEIDYHREAKRKLITFVSLAAAWPNEILPWEGMAVRLNKVLPWGGVVARPKEILPWGGVAARPKEILPWGGMAARLKEILLWGGAAARSRELSRPFGLKKLKHCEQVTISRFQAKKTAVLHVDWKRML